LGRHVKWVLEDQYRLAIYEQTLENPNWNPKVEVASEEDPPVVATQVFEVDLSAGRDC